VDGGVLDDVPVDVAKERGAKIIIVSNVAVIATLYDHGLRRSILEIAIDLAKRKRMSFKIGRSNSSETNILAESLQLLEKGYSRVTSPSAYTADFVIEPLDNRIHAFDFNKADEAYRLGREATLKVIDKIREKVREY